MNIDSNHIRSFQDELKKQLTAPSDKMDSRVKRLLTLHQNRINDGQEYGLKNSRSYYAIDRAYDVSQHQISPTLVQDLIDKNPGPKEVEQLARAWGLDKMLVRVDDLNPHLPANERGTNPKPGYLLQTQTFFKIWLPIMQSYVKMRWAKLFNDRDVHPLYKYDNLHMGMADRAVAKVTTQRQQMSSSQMGHRMVERDSIQKMLLYGQAINMPREAWYQEKQKIDGKERIVKEGIRWEIPHPVRTFYDRSHPLYTINTDTGCEWYGYWNMVPFGSIIDNPNYWLPPEVKEQKELKKKKKGEKGPEGWVFPVGWRTGDVFTNLYRHLYPCTINFPMSKGVAGISENDRTKSAFCYTADTLDTGIDISVLFHKIIPSEWGLYPYDYPVWHRFIYAGGHHVLFCEPVFYSPGVAFLYDYDAERATNSSLGFELLPFQDQLGNLLTQQMLTVKKNLMRIVAVNTDIVGGDFQSRAVNGTENALRGLEIFEYSGMRLKDQGTDISQAFYSVPLQQQTTVEIIAAINNIIGIMERALGYSAQEVGASASHQQSAAEVTILKGTASTRMDFTGSFVDDGIYARKKAHYYGLLHYSSDEFVVNVTELTPQAAEALKSKGFEIEQDKETRGLYSVKGKKSMLMFENLFSERDGQSRPSDQQTALMLQAFLDRLMANPQVGQALPIKFVFKFFNGVAEYLGLPPELKLPEDIEQQNAEQQAAQQQQLQQIVAAIVAQPMEQLSKAIGDLAGRQQQAEQAIEATSTAMAQNDQQLAGRQQNVEQVVGQLMGKLDQLLTVRAPA